MDNIFYMLSLEAELQELSLDTSIVKPISIVLVLKKGCASSLIGHSCGGAGTKIHLIVDAYGCPIYLLLSEGQRNDINMAIPLLSQINLNGNQVLAD